MAAYFDIGQSGVNPRDDFAHGTHVAGSVTADYLANGVWDGEDGLAPGARLVFQAIGTPTGGLAIPDDDYQLWRQAYRPSNPADVPETYTPADYAKYRPLEDARTHNNSYGLIVDLVDEGSADALDEFVWEHEDMVISVSAGNGGPGLGTIGSPSVAKNDLSSCASANGRQPMASIDSAAIFSSHGPTGDGRLGVDVCTPGQIVVSAKGGSSGDDHYLQGTSMSSPVLVGLATLVRQYFWDGFGPAEGQGLGVGTASVDRKWNPSAALVKATLVNGATRMRGFYTGDEGNARPLDGQWPSAGQGFGLVNLSESLYFPGDQRATWYRDVYRADDDAFGTGAVTAREYTVDVAEGQPLDVTLAYTDAPTGLPAGTPTLVNNLDLEVVGPGGTYRGNVANTRTTPGAAEHETPPNTGLPDVRNPVERVRIAAPDAGTYPVRVRPTAVLFGPQGFALTASGRIAEATGTPPTGQPLQVDDTGAPTIADVAVERVSADTARLTFSTDEPTTATATATPAGGGTPLEFADVYTYSDGSPFTTAYATGPVETSPVYADRPVLGTRHEILLYGLTAGTTYEVSLAATDLADQVSTGSTTFSSPGSAFQPLARDIGQLTAGATDNIPSTVRTGTGWRTGTQLYAGYSEEPTGLLTGLLAAFMFRLPEGVDPATVSGAAVEMTGGHVLASMYDVDPRMTVDLLDEAVEPRWGTQNFAEIQSAQATSRVPPETGLLRGGGTKRWFTFSCADLDALRNTLSTVDDRERRAAFRLHSTETITTSLPSYEFGFNRRSQGPELRPRLVLFGPDGAPNDQTTPCDSATPAPTVTEVAVADGATEGSVTVTWRTQVPSNSTVLYREKGATEFVQVGTPVRSTTHEVQVFGLDPSKDYEFGVRSTTCNGLTTTADNGGAGWDFFRPEPPPRTGVAHYFTGGPNDQANKLTFTPTATFGTDEPTGTSPIVQTSSSLNDPEAPYDPAAAYWTGPYSGTIDAEVDLPLHVWSGNANAIALGADVDIVFFADPENTLEAQPDRIIGAAQVELSPGVTPTLNTPRIRVTGTVASELQVGIYPVFVNTGTDIRISYGAASTPSGFVVLDPAPEALPVVGPVPASSAGSTGLDLASVPTRTEPTAADLAAGTGRCGSVTSPEEPPTDGDGAGAPARTAGRTLPPTGAQALLSLAAVALLAGAALMRRRVS